MAMSIFDHTHLRLFKQILIPMNLYQHVEMWKIRLLEIWLLGFIQVHYLFYVKLSKIYPFASLRWVNKDKNT